MIVGGRFARILVGRTMRDVGFQRRPQHEGRARALVERLDLQQHAPHVGMHDDRIGGLVGLLHAGNRAALQALAAYSTAFW